jgi:hypothetical protein
MPYKLDGRNLTNPVFDEVEARLGDAGALTTDETLTPDRKTFDEEVLKLILDRMVQEYGVDLLLHALFVDLERDGNSIRAINTYSKSGKQQVTGRVYVDGTGDGDLAARAGAPVEKGRSSDSLMQPMTLYFHVGGLPPDAHIPDLKQELVEIIAQTRASGELDEPYNGVHLHRTVAPDVYAMQCNHIVRLDATSVEDLTEAELRGRRGVHAVVEVFKRYADAFRNAHLIKTGVQVGVRESRRVMGEYLLDVPDLVNARKFPDGIAKSKQHVDIHNPEGPRVSGERIKVPAGDYYEIPYRSLLPKEVDNLLIGSRCISASHVAHGSYRMIPTVMSLGEAAGRAAAWAAQGGMSPADIDGAKLKERLDAK